MDVRTIILIVVIWQATGGGETPPPTQNELMGGLLDDWLDANEGILKEHPFARFSGASQIHRAAEEASEQGLMIKRGGRAPYALTDAGIVYGARMAETDWRKWEVN